LSLISKNESSALSCAIKTRVLLVLICLCSSLKAQVNVVQFNFSLDSSSTVSAGIFNTSGQLVRTLWSLKSLPAGTHTCDWDRLDDLGRLCIDTGYHLEVLSGRIQYKWEGVVGNNSDSITGSSKIRHFDRIKSMVVAGNWLYYASGYSEGVPSCYKVNINQPNRKYNILFEGKENVDQDAEFVATDSHYVYWGGMDPFNPSNTFVYATAVGSDTEVLFDSSNILKMYYGRTYSSVIALDTSGINAKITGMAVQKKGNCLFVSRSGEGRLDIYNKLKGQMVNSIPYYLPGLLQCDSKDRLWMQIGKDTLCQIEFDSLGQIDTVLKIKKLTHTPLAFTTTRNDSLLLVVIGDSLQQILAYNQNLDSIVWTFGKRGGYDSNNFVEDNRFYFSDDVTNLNAPFICTDQTDGFWVGDVGNARTLHFSKTKNLLDKIEYLPHSYSVALDINDSSRLFNEYLEYKIDYSKSLQPKNNSWRLYRNWRKGLDKAHYNASGINVVRNLVTMSNGKTIAYIDYVDSFNIRYPEMVVLPDTGNFQFTGRRLGKFDYQTYSKNLSRIWITGGNDLGKIQYVLKSELDSFDTLGLPVWKEQDTIAKVPVIEAWSPAYKGVLPITQTSTGKLVMFNAGKSVTGFHLGAIQQYDSSYKWLSSPSTNRNYRGPYPDDGTFDIGNGVEYPAATVNSVDKSTFWNYHGEFWKNSQTNCWQHVYDNGLMIGAFGVTTPDGITGNYEAFAGGSGNALSSALVKIGTDYYIYHCDESVHGGVHRWKVSGLNSIRLQVVRKNISPVNSGKVKREFFDGRYLDEVNFKSYRLDSVISNYQIGTSIVDSTDMSMRITGFIKTDSTDRYVFIARVRKGLRIWIDNQLLLDTFSNTGPAEFRTDSIELIGGKIYAYRIELNDYQIGFFVAGNNTARQSIGSAYLYASDTLHSDTIALMKGWAYNPEFKNGLYGWDRWPQNSFNTSIKDHWTIQTYIKSYDKEQPDLFMRFAKDSGTYYVERPLPKPGHCPVSWDIEGEVNFDEDFNLMVKNNQTLIEVLDDSLNVIASLQHSMLLNNNAYSTIIAGLDSVFVKQNGYFSNPYTNRFRTFKIHVDSNGADYQYGDNYLENIKSSSTWDKPSKLRIRFISGQGTFGAALALRNLTFSRKDSLQPKIYPLTPLRICDGDTITLNTDSFSNYLWSTSSTVQQTFASSSGPYYVRVRDAYCSGYSSKKLIGIKPNPSPVITLVGNVIKSNYKSGNSWYLNQVPIQGANDTTYTVTIPGMYSLLVTDTNGCESKVDMLVPLKYEQQPFEYGCNGDGRIWVEVYGSLNFELEYSDDGMSWSTIVSGSRIELNSGKWRYEYLVTGKLNRIFSIKYKDINNVSHRLSIDIEACIQQGSYSLLPNPFDSRLQLKLPETISRHSEIWVKIVDLSGQELKSQQISRGEREQGVVDIDVEGLSEGAYLVLIYENGVLRQKELLIRITP
jgi:hypothetical protein